MIEEESMRSDKIIKIVTPARICLFGDHQDYLGLPVIACAINKFINLTAEENTIKEFVISLPDINSERRFSISETFEYLKKDDHFASAIRVVLKHGCKIDRGFNLTISGNIPINAGVSSSSAILVAWIHFLLKAFGAHLEITPEFISQLAYEAEVLEHNSPGGKMDQYSIGIGNMVFIETGKYFNFEIIGNSLNGMILGESGVLKDTLGLLGIVKTNALKSIEIIKNEHPNFQIETATLKEYDSYVDLLSEKLKPYFYAAIQNHIITKKALIELKKPSVDLKIIGQLINEHHKILRDDLKITVPKVDVMIEAALQAGAYGAKIVGSGGGGCIVAISEVGNEKKISEAIKQAGGKDAYPVLVAKGTRLF